ncbi:MULTISPECIES: glutathione S-transferase family protein [Pseudomonas]|uniref:Glutathione S-transferase n=1 Tax=Pseudomonas chlororaphis subsp. aureofaciens TaxID=587851 RepID=A0AAD1E9W2_9PSED|nr:MULTISPECIES: glutathione S-transferase [Pseudomonas]AZD95873.1 Glutathione S-transferase [Pseudomonas chlororaphis subsp. aureofaciens]AZE02168.1 Glutathione S-transferase [Pseudomonas chlororaphis subsp. aureofaciens]AZE08286.1 Glutathione S-transferase [Pseudomonas chlororaphis subsp. aureofaciens]AZE14468.1 Glutathione S-transferase [Pseudomonas chlororaphis subsp. aureofaciens]AZE20433.1 Glutathione S-transferase [Pseudomonas chlororaphis subsp. aureofaciens]
MHAIKLYNFPRSGHAHRVELMLSLLGLPFELIFVDLAKGEHKQAAFLALNSFGQVPVIDDQGVVLADSNAILVYLAQKYGQGRWLPSDPVGAARVQRWLSVAAGPIAFGPAVARLITVFGAQRNAEEAIDRSHALLKVVEQELTASPYLAGSEPTIADIAGYSYIAHAPEGNVSLADYPQVRAWLARIEALPGFVGMPRTAVGLQSA